MHQAFLYISLPLRYDYDMKMPNFTFYGGRKQVTRSWAAHTHIDNVWEYPPSPPGPIPHFVLLPCAYPVDHTFFSFQLFSAFKI